jgi:hypothetical protein
MSFKLTQTEPRTITGNFGWSHSFTRYEVVDRVSNRKLGIVEEARRGWLAYLPNGTRTEFSLPSRKQAAEWLVEAAKETGDGYR